MSRTHGWLSKLWSGFGYPKYSVPYFTRDPQRDHNLDNHPYGMHFKSSELCSGSPVSTERQADMAAGQLEMLSWVLLQYQPKVCMMQAMFTMAH